MSHKNHIHNLLLISLCEYNLVKLNENTTISVQENRSENADCKMAAFLFRQQYVEILEMVTTYTLLPDY